MFLNFKYYCYCQPVNVFMLLYYLNNNRKSLWKNANFAPRHFGFDLRCVSMLEKVTTKKIISWKTMNDLVVDSAITQPFRRGPLRHILS